jgi:branched-chain amino acid transport system ATP-binding protein
MAGLTPHEAEEMLGVVRTFHRDLGLTILLIEHMVKLVTGLCSRIVVLNFGRLIAEGRPEEVLRHEGVIEAYLGKRYRERYHVTGEGP